MAKPSTSNRNSSSRTGGAKPGTAPSTAGASSRPVGGSMTQRFARRGRRGGELGNAPARNAGKGGK
jgi:hypothetical protein